MTSNPPQKPSRSDRLKPVELVGLSGVMALFVGLTILLTTRELLLSVIALGITFIVVLVVIAMFALNIKPDEAERNDLDEQDKKH
ncbi:hypothetical protein GCM10022381_21230 [Leifsonia kafniensis]|uniref:ABC transporter ATP-binding protein n=1 Tax=Leifsonia kafniensis TaxID=475957 RepID=A0ABP7KL40_9MICO